VLGDCCLGSRAARSIDRDQAWLAEPVKGATRASGAVRSHRRGHSTISRIVGAALGRFKMCVISMSLIDKMPIYAGFIAIGGRNKVRP